MKMNFYSRIASMIHNIFYRNVYIIVRKDRYYEDR